MTHIHTYDDGSAAAATAAADDDSLLEGHQHQHQRQHQDRSFLPDGYTCVQRYALDLVAFLRRCAPLYNFYRYSSGSSSSSSTDRRDGNVVIEGEDNVVDFLRADHWRTRGKLWVPCGLGGGDVDSGGGGGGGGDVDSGGEEEERTLPGSQSWAEWRDALMGSTTDTIVRMVAHGITDTATECCDAGDTATAAAKQQGDSQQQQQLWPQSLQAFVRRAHALRLPYRETDQHHQHWQAEVEQHVRHVDYIMQQGMSEKKRYEVRILASLVHRVAHEARCGTVVDIGSGQGYLTRAIAFEQHTRHLKQNAVCMAHSGQRQQQHSSASSPATHLTVVGIDTDELQTRGAEQRVHKLVKRIIHKRRQLASAHIAAEREEDVARSMYASVKSVTSHLDLSIGEDAFLSLLKPLLAIDAGDGATAAVAGGAEGQQSATDRMLMIGLHTCGDLSSTMLRLFVQSDAAALVNVGCCYHRLTERYDAQRAEEAARCKRDAAPGRSTVSFGYPMSRFLAEHRVDLSTAGRCLACLATSRWQHDADRGVLRQSRQQFLNASFRCALQCVLHDMFGLRGDQTAIVGSVPRRHSRTFGVYALFSLRKMLSKMGGSSDGSNTTLPSAFRTNYTEEQLSQLKQRIERFLGSRPHSDLQQELDALYERRFHTPATDPIKQVEVWWSLRALLGPVIEALILVDRLLFLREHGNIRAHLVRAFDPVQSPRGLVIVASKERAGPCVAHGSNGNRNKRAGGDS